MRGLRTLPVEFTPVHESGQASAVAPYKITRG